MKSARQRFLDYVKDGSQSERPVVSPFLPEPGIVQNCLISLGEKPIADAFADEIKLSRILDYEPMFMTEMSSLIFPWKPESESSEHGFETRVIRIDDLEWRHRIPKKDYSWNDDVACPVKTETDHDWIVRVCDRIGDQENLIRNYFRDFRQRVGEDGVIVLGHPHPSWLGYQISPERIYYHWMDFPKTFKKSMDALYEASCYVMEIAIGQGIDFCSDSSYGLEMTSPALFREMDLPYIQNFAKFSHDRDCLFWYHNCGYTRNLILSGSFNTLGADVIETIAPPPEGDNDLAESRRALDARICSKGNFPLTLLRDGRPDEIEEATRTMVRAVQGSKHILSTADAVLPGTPAENYINFVRSARAFSES